MTIRTVGSKQTRIKTIGEKQRRISSQELAKALGGEFTGIKISNSDPYIAGQLFNLLKIANENDVPTDLVLAVVEQTKNLAPISVFINDARLLAKRIELVKIAQEKRILRFKELTAA